MPAADATIRLARNATVHKATSYKSKRIGVAARAISEQKCVAHMCRSASTTKWAGITHKMTVLRGLTVAFGNL